MKDDHLHKNANVQSSYKNVQGKDSKPSSIYEMSTYEKWPNLEGFMFKDASQALIDSLVKWFTWTL